MAIVNALNVRNRWGDGRNGCVGPGAETVAKEKLFVFAVEVEDLENFRAGFLDCFFSRGIRPARSRCGVGLEGGEAFVEAGEEGAFSVEERGVGRALVVF